MILDRLTFMRFLGFTLADTVPDEKTIWAFRQKLVDSKKIEVLFERFRDHLQDEHLLVNSGSIVDATIVNAPKQRNTRDENHDIKNGKTPQEWEDKPEKKRQKDRDARWVKKNNVNYYGYKNHIKIDKKTKIIKTYSVTDVSVHDSQVVESLLDESDERWPIYADSAYSGEPIKKMVQGFSVLFIQ
jgi:IS5 family transposase